MTIKEIANALMISSYQAKKIKSIISNSILSVEEKANALIDFGFEIDLYTNFCCNHISTFFFGVELGKKVFVTQNEFSICDSKAVEKAKLDYDLVFIKTL